MKTLIKLRSELDSIDEAIVKLLSQRLELVKKVGEVKKINNLPVYDEVRKKQALEERITWGNSYGVSPSITTKLYKCLHQIAVDIEECHQR